MSPQAAQNPVEAETPEKRRARVEGIKKLIQQASSNVRPEAEAAAYRACALIRKHGLDLVDPSLVDDLHQEIHTLKVQLEAARAGVDDHSAGYQPPVSHFSTRHTHSTSHMGGGGSASFWGAVGNVGKTGFGGVPPKATTPPPRHAPPPPPPQAPPPPPKPQYVAAAKFASRCKHCGKVMQVGEPILWIKSTGVWCPTTSCYQDWVNNTNSAAGFTSPFSTP